MRYLTDEQHIAVSSAVEEAERQTSGEIVTVLADRSDGYSDVVLIGSIAISFTVMSVLAMFPAALDDLWHSVWGGWGDALSAGWLITLTLVAGLLALILSWALFSYDPVRFALIPGPIKSARSREAAIRHFRVGAERRTHGRTGVLLYLSMREHRAEIVADESIAGRIPAEVWGEAMADMLAGIRAGQLAEGLAAGIRDVGVVLAQQFPRDEHDTNELPDRIIEV